MQHEKKEEPTTICPANPQEWRQWLEEHHQSMQSVWLVYYKKKSGISSLSWSQAVDEALCFGWIDSKSKTLDDEKYMQFFCKRKPNSIWSKINKVKIEQLIADGRMRQAGLDAIERAKQNGSWTSLDDVEALVIPDDLERELDLNPGAKDFLLGLSKSVQKSILYWVTAAKRPETRQKRIAEIVAQVAQKQKPKVF